MFPSRQDVFNWSDHHGGDALDVFAFAAEQGRLPTDVGELHTVTILPDQTLAKSWDIDDGFIAAFVQALGRGPRNHDELVAYLSTIDGWDRDAGRPTFLRPEAGRNYPPGGAWASPDYGPVTQMPQPGLVGVLGPLVAWAKENPVLLGSGVVLSYLALTGGRKRHYGM